MLNFPMHEHEISFFFKYLIYTGENIKFATKNHWQQSLSQTLPQQPGQQEKPDTHAWKPRPVFSLHLGQLFLSLFLLPYVHNVGHQTGGDVNVFFVNWLNRLSKTVDIDLAIFIFI